MAVRGNPNQYLKLIGRSWYVSITVPRTLQNLRGSHIRAALGTRDVGKANKLKHDVVARIKAKLAWDSENILPDGTLPQMRAHPEALELRDALREAKALDPPNTEHSVTNVDIITGLIADRAHDIEAVHGEIAAQEFVERATAVGGTLKELQVKWLADCDGNVATKDGYARSVRELLKFHRREDVLPNAIGQQHALNFINAAGGLKARGLSSRTIIKKLASLSLFWRWMERNLHIPKGSNPWLDHQISTKNHTGSRKIRRPFTDAEVLAILHGNERALSTRRHTVKYLPDLIVLALYSGARIEEISSMSVREIVRGEDFFTMQVLRKHSKNKASARQLAFTSQAAREIIERRTINAPEDAKLFPELTPGGIGKDKFSSSAGKAFTRYRRACGVPDGTDFHSFRRVTMDVMENIEIDADLTKRFVGHELGTQASKYSGGAWLSRVIKASRLIVYSPEIEAAALACAKRAGCEPLREPIATPPEALW